MASDFWFKFNFKDWADDVKPLSLQARGLLIELIIYLRRQNGEMKVDIPLLCRLTGGLSEEITGCLTEFKTFGILDFDYSGDGVCIMSSRRIKKEIAKSLINRENGAKGGNPRLTDSDKAPVGKPDNRYSNSIFNSNYNSFLLLLNEALKKNFKGSDKSKKQFYARMNEGRTMDEFNQAIKNAVAHEYHKETGYKYITPEFLTRADKLDTFSQVVEVEPELNTPRNPGWSVKPSPYAHENK